MFRSSFLRGRSRADSQRETGLSVERLESRLVLSADLFSNLADNSWLTINSDAYDPGSILVRFREEVICSGQGHDCHSAHVPQILEGTHPGRYSSLMSGFTTVALDDTVSVVDALAAYRTNPNVIYAEPNYRIELERVPDDTQLADLWGLNNTGQTGGTADADIDAVEAWEVTTGGGNTLVAVIDTGVDYTHPDLAENIWSNMDELNGLPNVDDDGNGFVDDIHGYDFFNNDGDPMDDHNHGTHVAGTIGAVGDNGLGVVGVNWDVQIMAVKFLDANGGGNMGDAIDAIDYAVANGATISNNSWGFNGAFSPALHDAILQAADAGHIFTAAAGNGDFLGNGLNNDVTPFYPAGFELDNVVAVAALDHNDNLATFSNFGRTTVDLGAPGVGILSTIIGGAYDTFNGTSMATPHVTGVLALVSDLHPEWSYQQVIDVILESVDPIAALADRAVTGGRLNAARAVSFSGPEIRVVHDGTIVTDQVGHVDFGNALIGVPLTETFTVKNVGLEDLQLGPVLHVPDGFVVSSPFGATTLAPGEATTVEVTLAATTLGAFEGELSFVTNDSDESPMNFNLGGTVSTVVRIDDGDSHFRTSGDWTPWQNEGFQNDMTFSPAGNGLDVATWDFDVTPGRYAVSATWSVLANRANNSPYTITDGTGALETVRVDQEIEPDDLIDMEVGWENLGTYSIVDNRLSVQLSNDANEYVIADGVRIERLGDLPPGPEIEVRTSGELVADNTGQVDFGENLYQRSTVRDFLIRNIGSEELTIGSTISVPDGFAVSIPPATTTLPPGASTSFQVELNTSEIVAYGGQLSLATNDADEDPFNFNVTGSVTATQIVDDSDAGFTSAGQWFSYPYAGYQGDLLYSDSGAGADVATWVMDVMPGQYRVATTWTPQSDRATNAPYTLRDDGATVGTIQLNQQVAPDDFSDQGADWEILGDFEITGTRLTVELSDAANGYVIADGVRIQRLDLPPTPEVELTLDGVVIDAGSGSVDFGATLVAAPVTRAFTVTNVGGLDLALQGPILVPTGFTVISPPVATTLAPGESTSFAVQLDASALGDFSGQLSFETNDSDEAIYAVQVQGSVVNSRILDNGDPGFSTSGAWTSYNFEGYQSDFHYNELGGVLDVARWDFSVAPGQYQVAATWTAQTNRATDAPYTITDGTTALGTVDVNQEQLPSDFTDAGAWWHILGTFTVSGNTLVVELADDANEYVIADGVRIERLGDLPTGPEIAVQLDGVEVADEAGLVDFGNTSYGAAVQKTFVVRNEGGADLVLDGQVTLPAGFSLATPFAATTLAPGESTTLAVQLDALDMGTVGGQISLGNNDADEAPYNFTLTGTVTSVQILDNGDPGFSTSGAWTSYNFEGYQSDFHYNELGGVLDVARWDFSVAPGQYQVAATWTAQTNRATDAPYTITDGTTALGTVDVNQEQLPSDFTDAGAWWHILGIFTVSGNTLVVELADDANEYVIADGVRIERLGDLPTGPEIAVQLDGVEVADEAGLVDFGNTSYGAAVQKTFVVRNEGGADLVLDGQVTLPAGFSLATPFAATTLAPGESTTLAVQLDALDMGTVGGQISLGNNDADEAPYNFTLTGTVTSVQILDNGDPGFSTSGAWTSYNFEGYQSDFHYNELGGVLDVARWDFSVAPGQYQVAATWTAQTNRATDAPYTITDGTTALGTVDVNQEQLPSDFTDAGAWWHILGTFTVSGNTLVVELADDANEYVIADGVRIERLGDLPTGPEIAVQLDGVEVADEVGLVDFGNTSYGAAVQKTFVVRNEGGADLVLDGQVTLPAGFSLATPPAATTLAPGESTTLAVQLDALDMGTVGGQISLGNNDADEAPYNFTLTGTVTSVQILDNGDPGFSTSGAWTSYNFEGYQSDFHYNELGGVLDVARWDFSVAPGQYQVAATWTAQTNRATDAPYTITDGTTALGTVDVNQEQLPSDFTDAGAWWHILGTFTVSGNTLVVELADDANEYVIADGVRIERLGDIGGLGMSNPGQPIAAIDQALGAGLAQDYRRVAIDWLISEPLRSAASRMETARLKLANHRTIPRSTTMAPVGELATHQVQSAEKHRDGWEIMPLWQTKLREILPDLLSDIVHEI